MKGPTLREQWDNSDRCTRPRVVWDGPWLSWCWECGDVQHGHYAGNTGHITHAEALAAANVHALEHLGEDTARWAADEFAVGSEVWQEDQQ